MRFNPPRQRGGPSTCGIVLTLAAVIALSAGQPAAGQTSQRRDEGVAASGDVPANPPESSESLLSGDEALKRWAGLSVHKIEFQGVAADRLTGVSDHLAQREGAPLLRSDVAESLRQLFATGLYDSVDAAGTRDGEEITLIFRGVPRIFIGTVDVTGAKGATINTQLERASRLSPGTRFTQTKLKDALAQMQAALAENGYHEPTITQKTTEHPDDQLVDLAFTVVSGPRARVGTVTVNGDSGISLDEFREHAHLRPGAVVDHDTVNRALSGVLKLYQRQKHLEAEIKLQSQTYAGHRMNYVFTANRGPVVSIFVTGAPIELERLKHLVPVYEEGAVDDDLLNEGNRRLRDYYQSLGWFDVKVDHAESSPTPGRVSIEFKVDLGTRRKVARVGVAGNHYFDSPTLVELLGVHPASFLEAHGAYSQALISADVSALEAVYQNNGFSKAKVTPSVNLTPVAAPAPGKKAKPAELAVVYNIEEGAQQRVGKVALEGNAHVGTEKLLPLLNTEAGQLVSPRNLAGDRDALVTDYMAHGFDEARVEVDETNDPQDANLVNVTFRIIEGEQIFVRNVLVTGLVYTRPDTVARGITLHAGDPLSQSALMETQRNLYEYALFNEVNTAIQNPRGDQPYKTVLLQAVEARRWTLTYGGGFETQTGQPRNNCRGYIASGVSCSPGGRTGVSPRILLAITRNNLFGREQSASVQGTYGLLEQKVNLIYQNPHLLGRRALGLTFTGGYANSQDVTTYVASRLDASLRVTQNFNSPGSFLSRANTLIYEFDFRRVKVAEDSLQVFPSEVPVLAAAVRVGGPGFTWLRDTRDNPIDAHRGTYTSFQDFLSAPMFGAEVGFNRIDVSNSNFIGFDKNRFVLARNTRYGQERAFGDPNAELIPLPERLYSGGATSHRGFSINAAGPRDPDTGYPIGGAGALINSTELRLPPPTLPYFGDAISLVIFHDMGNVFTNAGDAWESALRVRQPDRNACKVLTPPNTSTHPPTEPPPSGGPVTSTGPQGACSFNYFSHAPGLGLRYHTPVGPIRLDFSYNLNPPIFPINVNYSQSDPTSNQHVGEAGHFNFFFSLGQTF